LVSMMRFLFCQLSFARYTSLVPNPYSRAVSIWRKSAFVSGSEFIDGGTNFVVAMALEDIENGLYVFEFVDSGAFRTFYAKSHSTLEVIYHCNHEKVIAHKP
jgi:hypothetical protein